MQIEDLARLVLINFSKYGVPLKSVEHLKELYKTTLALGHLKPPEEELLTAAKKTVKTLCLVLNYDPHEQA